MKKNLVVHVNEEFAIGVIEAMKKANYKLKEIASVPGFIHLEFKRIKK